MFINAEKRVIFKNTANQVETEDMAAEVIQDLVLALHQEEEEDILMT